MDVAWFKSIDLGVKVPGFRSKFYPLQGDLRQATNPFDTHTFINKRKITIVPPSKESSTTK